MVREYAQCMRPATDISPEKHVQLLKMTHERLMYSFSAMPFVATFAALFYGNTHDIKWMAVWALGYCIAYFFSKQRISQFTHDELTMTASNLLAVWHPRLLRLATLHGLALCAPFVLTAADPSFEFTTLWYLVVAAIIAGNATHQTPVLDIFVRFFNCSWNLATLLSVIAYPNHWQFIAPMILMYTAGIYRHALMAHKFFYNKYALKKAVCA